MAAPRAILVIGATGKQGGAVVNALLALPTNGGQSAFTILAVTRNIASPGAQRLQTKSPNTIKLVQGDLNDCPALFAAARAAFGAPIWGVFSVQTAMGQTGPGGKAAVEVAQGKAVIDEARKAGVSHFVYSSVERGGDEDSWTNGTLVPHFRTKWEVERHLRDSAAAAAAMSWTILRPVAFMDNLEPGMATRVFVASLKNHLGWERRPLQWVATRDIGVFAAKAFADPGVWKGRAVGLAGDELTVEGLDDAFREATGEGVRPAWGILGSALTTVAREVGTMIAWFASDGYKADIAARRKEHPGMLTMVEWLKQESGFVKR